MALKAAFHLDVRVLAKVALTTSWFPFQVRPDHGIVGIADIAAQRRILAAAKTLRLRPETIEIRGIDVPPR